MMRMSDLRPSMNPARAASWAISGCAALAGGWFSYGFGSQIGGVLLGVVAALNGAVLCSMLASSILARVMRRTDRE